MVVEKDKTEECYRILEAEANKLIESGEYDPLEVAGVMCAQAIKIYPFYLSSSSCFMRRRSSSHSMT